MSENSNIDDNRVGNASKSTEEEVAEVCVLTREAVNEQIKGSIAPFRALTQGPITLPFLAQRYISPT